jgi:DNA-binding MarR family transcriptional regulator
MYFRGAGRPAIHNHGRMTFDRHRSPGYVVNHLARLFASALVRRIGVHGVTPGPFPVLLSLWEREGVTQAALADELAVEQPTMANTLKRMERDGLVRRAPDPDDRRRARIRLTPRGRALEPVLTASARATNAVALAGLSPVEAAQFLALAARIVANLERDASHGAPQDTGADAGGPPPDAASPRPIRATRPDRAARPPRPA